MFLSFLTFNVIFMFLHFGCSYAKDDNECRQSVTAGRARRCIGFERFPRLRVEQSPNFQPRYIPAQPRSRDQEHVVRERPASQRYPAARRPPGSSLSPGHLTRGNRPGTHPSSNYRPMTYNGNIWGGSNNNQKPVGRNYQEFMHQKKPTSLSRPAMKSYENNIPTMKNNHDLNDFDNGFPTRKNKYGYQEVPSNYRYTPPGLWNTRPRGERHQGTFARPKNYGQYPKAVKPLRKMNNYQSFNNVHQR